MLSPSQFLILPAQPPDTNKVYDIYFRAFAGSALTRILFPSAFPSPSDTLPTAEFRASHTAHTLAWLASPASSFQYTFKAVDVENGEVVGMGLWDIHYKHRDEEEWKWKGVEWLASTERERAEQLLGEMVHTKERFVGGKPHVYCHVIAVHPEYQKRGIGRRLMQWGVEVGEQAGLPVYLESSKEGEGLYRSLGFEEVGRVRHRAELIGESEDVEVPLMVRMPGSLGIGWVEWCKQ
ncbi:acyl-CoA N-acyltransferase [Mytilinidion resinicola]|uniref:Acyl-CoA N-acyltransferase n=1 Tax=Mytilinidion resinicola TaxID=574789 RepID=A0A6A6XZ32_9PEZI|nr:acyl-CoA N-acyltransferase [Mytilinidion resinicola]KAF2801821.1 acyl-CoA N-acyltransferase [Mytilinidion resinicola]